MGSLRARVALLALSSALAVLAAEALVRLVRPRPGFVPRQMDDPAGQWVPHATRGFAFAPGFRGRWTRSSFDVGIEINALGFRGPRPPEGADGVRILAAGDSLTFGWGVEAAEAWPARLQGALAARAPAPIVVVNAGVPAYGPRQIRLLVEEEVARLAPDLVVLGLYVGGLDRLAVPYALAGDMLVRADRLAGVQPLGDGYLYTPASDPRVRRVELWLDRYFHLGAHAWHVLRRVRGEARGGSPDPPADARRLVDATVAEVRTLAAGLELRRVRMVVLLMATQARAGGFPADQRAAADALGEACHAAGIPVLSALPWLEEDANGAPRFRFGDDAHWNAPAHALVAARLGEALVAAGLLGPRRR